jgi:hypothetical protein
MGYLGFRSTLAEKWMMSFKWSRNNTLLILQELSDSDLELKPEGERWQNIGFQFSCLVTTTDTYFRKITKHKDSKFGKAYIEGKVYTKEDLISGELLFKILEAQVNQLNDLIREMDEKDLDKHLRHLINITNHEYLHQGQLVSYFTMFGKKLPARFKKSWAL